MFKWITLHFNENFASCFGHNSHSGGCEHLNVICSRMRMENLYRLPNDSNEQSSISASSKIAQFEYVTHFLFNLATHSKQPDKLANIFKGIWGCCCCFLYFHTSYRNIYVSAKVKVNISPCEFNYSPHLVGIKMTVRHKPEQKKRSS